MSRSAPDLPDAPSRSRPRASIVVPTHQRRDSVLRLLGALAGQTVDADLFDVTVAIDGSEDGTREALAVLQTPFAVRAVWQPQRGRAAACNAGVRAASGEIVVLLDDDMEPAPGFVAAHLSAHRSGDAVGVVGAAPIVVPPDAPAVVAYRARGFAHKLERLEATRDSLAFNDVYTGNFSIRRELLVAAGGFDEAFTLYGHEDYELVLRLGRTGVRFRFEPAALARQHYTKALHALAANIVAEGQTAVLFARKHPDALESLYLSEFARFPRGRRARLRAMLALSRAVPTLPDRVVGLLARRERGVPPSETTRLFARYDLLFDVLYWLGVERALAGGGPVRAVPFAGVERAIAAARSSS